MLPPLRFNRFSLVFYPVEGDALTRAEAALWATLQRVDAAIGAATPGPWLLGGDSPSYVDLQFIATLERLSASALYWKGVRVRSSVVVNSEGTPPRCFHLERWLDAFDARPAYAASKADLYSTVMALPSQNGPGYAVDAAKHAAAAIYGFDGAWELPTVPDAAAKPNAAAKLDAAGIAPSLDEPVPPSQSEGGEEAAKIEAAYRLVNHHESIVRFAARGASPPGRPAFHAELADPNAEPDEAMLGAIDVCLRHVAASLVDGVDVAAGAAQADLSTVVGDDASLADGWSGPWEDCDGRPYYWDDESGASSYTRPTRELDDCLAYLRDRIGVPRDLPLPAAMMLRKHLNWAIAIVRGEM